MEKSYLKAILEAVIFAAEEPIGLTALCGILEKQGAGKNEVKAGLQELMSDYNENETKGLMLREVGLGYQFVTKPNVAEFVNKLDVSKPKTLSQASLETLSIIAYRQPVVRSEIEQIRGVDSGGVLKTLLERGYIKIVGRREEAGQPLIYGTTPAFLELFHLTNLEELPSMKEIEQIVEESQRSREETAAGEEPTEEGLEAEAGDANAFEPADTPDSEAIEELESSIKSLRQLEREIFPKEQTQEETSNPAEEQTKNPPSQEP